MITEKILDFFFALGKLLLKLLPDVSWNVNSGAWQGAKKVLDGVCYFLPLGTITAIISLIISIALFRAFIALIKLIKSFLPFM